MAASTNLVDDLETAFQSCLALLTTQEHFNVDSDTDEIKNNVEQSVSKFLEAVKQLDCFFIQKRVLLSAAMPDQCIVTDLSELHQELQRKEVIIQKHYERLQSITNRMSGGSAVSQPHPSPAQGHPVGQGQPSGMTPAAGSSQGPSQATHGPQAAGQGQQGFNQGPLAYLEQTTSNIGQSRM